MRVKKREERQDVRESKDEGKEKGDNIREGDMDKDEPRKMERFKVQEENCSVGGEREEEREGEGWYARRISMSLQSARRPR